MPIYEYVCTSCGNEFEAMQKFSDAPLTDCECGESGTVERKLSLAAFQLKGGGWYKDRYGSSANGKNGNGDAGAAAKGDSKDSGSSSGSEVAKTASHACGGACSCG